jgi:hypothetical protein
VATYDQNDPNQSEANVTYYCKTEADRRYYAKNERYSLIPAIVGTSVAVLAGVATVIFYFYPEWFSSEESGASLALTPVLGPGHSGLYLTCSF